MAEVPSLRLACGQCLEGYSGTKTYYPMLECIAQALATMEGIEVSLAAWRVHATAAELHELTSNSGMAAHHRALSRATILQLAQSLPADEPLRHTFLSAPAVAKVLGDAACISRSP